jgi:translation initiation factor 2B subunit (eIF-2B alpha/beta/delta family)
MKRFYQILQDIKEVRIQGATNVASAGIKAFLINPSKEAAEKIISLRPTEPFLQHSIGLLLKSKDKKQTARKILSYLKESNKRITKQGERLIKNEMNIFVHCHSSSVINILIKAKKQGKRFVVYNTETLPLYQGRRTAEELAKAGIKVIHLPDTAAEYAIRKCDLFLFGADAYLKKGVVNKSGTSMFCEIAKLYKIPCYSCGISLKYTGKTKIEFRPSREVWNERNKNIQILNPAFDFVPKKLITGVVSELGILPYSQFARLAKKNLKSFLK